MDIIKSKHLGFQFSNRLFRFNCIKKKCQEINRNKSIVYVLYETYFERPSACTVWGNERRKDNERQAVF